MLKEELKWEYNQLGGRAKEGNNLGKGNRVLISSKGLVCVNIRSRQKKENELQEQAKSKEEK